MNERPGRELPRAAKVLVVLPGGVSREFWDCDVQLRITDRLVNLFRERIRLVTAPLDLCIIFWTEEAAAGVLAQVPRRPREGREANRND